LFRIRSSLERGRGREGERERESERGTDKGNGRNTQKTEWNCRGMESCLLINNIESYTLIT